MSRIIEYGYWSVELEIDTDGHLILHLKNTDGLTSGVIEIDRQEEGQDLVVYCSTEAIEGRIKK